jgi:hypothetical protein
MLLSIKKTAVSHKAYETNSESHLRGNVEVKVKGILAHSCRGNSKIGHLNKLVQKYWKTGCYNMIIMAPDFNCNIKKYIVPKLPQAMLVNNDRGSLLINMCKYASYIYSVQSSRVIKEKTDALLTLCSRHRNNKVQLFVKGKGTGMSKEVKNKIFEPFFTPKKGTEGTGHGLSITHDFVKAYGGELIIETAIDKDTIFIIKLYK